MFNQTDHIMRMKHQLKRPINKFEDKWSKKKIDLFGMDSKIQVLQGESNKSNLLKSCWCRFLEPSMCLDYGDAFGTPLDRKRGWSTILFSCVAHQVSNQERPVTRVTRSKKTRHMAVLNIMSSFIQSKATLSSVPSEETRYINSPSPPSRGIHVKLKL